MNDLTYWILMALLQLLIYLLPSVKLEKGKWIRKHTAAETSFLGDSVETMAAMPQIQVQGRKESEKRCNH